MRRKFSLSPGHAPNPRVIDKAPEVACMVLWRWRRFPGPGSCRPCWADREALAKEQKITHGRLSERLQVLRPFRSSGTFAPLGNQISCASRQNILSARCRGGLEKPPRSRRDPGRRMGDSLRDLIASELKRPPRSSTGSPPMPRMIRARAIRSPTLHAALRTATSCPRRQWRQRRTRSTRREFRQPFNFDGGAQRLRADHRHLGVTANRHDYGYEKRSRGRSGGRPQGRCLHRISTSGRSPNILRAFGGMPPPGHP